ncbi:MAG: hypothetical protein M3Y87_19160, partial [Myxococcota bacterium]|nr:hypothetical protein [Myxococcota bacterium]
LEPGATPLRPQPSSNFVRRLVLSGMPPPRLAELHRFVAEALLERGADDEALPSLRAELGLFEIEGGLDARGAERLVAIGRVAITQGYRRAASRIATLLARLGSPSADALSRAAATVAPLGAWEDDEAPASTEISLDEIERTSPGHVIAGDAIAGDATVDGAIVDGAAALEPQHPAESERLRGPPTEERPSSFAAAAEDAVRTRDLEALDRLVERAIASGSDMAAIARFRALSDLLRGDIGGARRALEKARGYRRANGPRDPREEIVEAAVALGSGDAGAAVRLGLRALALARRASDRKGELAALRMVAACYRALGRGDDAARLEAASG